MPEVFYLCEYATLNGGERSMLATLDGLRAAGFAPVVLAPPQGPLAEALATGGFKLLPFQCRMANGGHIPKPQLREELHKILHRHQPALFHANSLAMGRLSGPVAAQLALPSVSHLRDIVGLSNQAVADLNCHRRLLAVSEATREFHLSGGLAAEKVHVLYNGVDLEQFRPRRPTGYLHRELGLPPESPLIGAIGQISLRKGQDVLIDAARRIADQSPHAHYLIVGRRHSEKDESRRFERALHETAQKDLSGRVHFLGVRDDICQLLSDLTLLVHAARQEPLGRVLLEAASAGTAIVATRVGGTPEIFPPETDAARLVPPDDPRALGGAILELLGDAALRQRLAVAARRRAEMQFNISSTVKKLLDHYRSLAQS